MAKIESGKVAMRLGTLDLPAMLADLNTIFSLRCQEKKVAMRVESADDLPTRFYTDPGKLRQILTNLLNNAVKFIEVGSITLRVGASNSPGSSGSSRDVQLEFAVVDTGPGIAEVDQQRLFDKYEQGENGDSAGEGTGLGLPICREYVHLLGGELRLTSTLGKGSTFSFDIRVSVADTPAASEQQPKPTLALSKLDRDCLADLHKAAVEADIFQLTAIADSITAGQPDLANQLRHLVANYAYDELLTQLNSFSQENANMSP